MGKINFRGPPLPHILRATRKKTATGEIQLLEP